MYSTIMLIWEIYVNGYETKNIFKKMKQKDICKKFQRWGWLNLIRLANQNT